MSTLVRCRTPQSVYALRVAVRRTGAVTPGSLPRLLHVLSAPSVRCGEANFAFGPKFKLQESQARV